MDILVMATAHVDKRSLVCQLWNWNWQMVSQDLQIFQWETGPDLVILGWGVINVHLTPHCGHLGHWIDQAKPVQCRIGQSNLLLLIANQMKLLMEQVEDLHDTCDNDLDF